jgi:hypothetical protein
VGAQHQEVLFVVRSGNTTPATTDVYWEVGTQHQQLLISIGSGDTTPAASVFYNKWGHNNTLNLKMSLQVQNFNSLVCSKEKSSHPYASRLKMHAESDRWLSPLSYFANFLEILNELRLVIEGVNKLILQCPAILTSFRN